LLITAPGGAGNQDDTPSPFKGRVVIISSHSDIETGAALHDPVIKKLGEQEFLVGVSVDDGQPDDWQKGHTVWVAIDDIAQLVEFANVDEARKVAAEARASDDQ
jgi:hypothetical protein